MTLEGICSLPVPSIAHDNCALFLWVTMPQLPDAFKVISAWGFEYKTAAFVWVKLNRKSGTPFFGLGHWTRSNAELCLLATKGSCERMSKSVRQTVLSPIEAHSKKPDEIRESIIMLLGDLPRVELFARQRVPGWDAWGNEVDSDLSLIQLDGENHSVFI